MGEERSGDSHSYIMRLKRAASAMASDDNSPEIERLESRLAEEKVRSEALGAEVDQLRFQIQILERSYAKQLDEARQKAEAATQSLTRAASGVATLKMQHQQATEALNEVRTSVQRAADDWARLNRRTRSANAEESAAPNSENDLPEGTINQLLAAMPKKPQGPSFAESLPPTGTDHGALSDELLSPDIMFQDKDKEKKKHSPS